MTPPRLTANMIRKYFLLATLALSPMSHAEESKTDEQWIPLFNGKDLSQWTPKFTGRPLGENFRDTFQVKNGILKVDYSQWDEFKGEFGHLYYNTPYSHYKIRATYRFVGKQLKGAPEWAVRNNGLMIHCQDPKTLDLEQQFPNCVEVQLLGGNGKDDRPTLNIVTPGTHVFWKGELQKRHVLNAGGPTFHGDQWVTVEVEVRGDKIKHLIDGKVLCEYSQVQLDNGEPVNKGYISIQAESGPCEFKKIELLPLPNPDSKK